MLLGFLHSRDRSHQLRVSSITPVYVERMPDKLEEGRLYISASRKLALHKCCCGCGEEVVTPLNSKAGWVVTKEGDQISLYPSIGNWNFACQSHYWIKKNRVVWSYQMSEKEISRVKARDQIDMQAHIAQQNASKKAQNSSPAVVVTERGVPSEKQSWLDLLSAWWRGK